MTEGNGDSVVRRDRYSGGPAREFLSSLAADQRIFGADLAVDRAHVVMLDEEEIIDAETAGRILSALGGIEAAGHDALPAGEDVHEAIESAVIDGIDRDGATLVDGVGAPGGRMHTARSRNDEVATCIRYRLRADILDLEEAILTVRETLLESADEHTETVMPGYTHLQPAQPTTVAHWLCSYESALARDAERLRDCYARVNRSPLGAGAFAGVSFAIDRDRTAELLGFEGVIENSADAAASRDFLLETAGACSTLATTLSGLAEDAIVFAKDGHLDLDDEYASTSSIMPQKKNPDTLELVRATAGDALAGLSGLFATLKGLPRAYNRDLQRADPHVWNAIDQLIEATDVAGGAIGTATWQLDALANDSGQGFSTATGVADLLAQAGVPFRTAHEVVARAAETGADYEAIADATEAVLGESLETYVEASAVRAALEPAESVAMRDSLGGPAPEQTEAAIERASDALRHERVDLDASRESLEAAAATLTAEVNERT